MILPLLTELKINGVYDRGIPNKERIVINVVEPINMGNIGLMLGLKSSFGMAIPIRDNLFWFGDGNVSPEDWIFLYTGPGANNVYEIPNSNKKSYNVHWNRNQTILNNPELVPILFKVETIQVHETAPLLSY